MLDPSPSTLTVLNSNFLQLGRRSGGRPQRTVALGGYLSTVIHTTLAGIEPTAHAQFLACTISYLGYVCILLFAFSGFSFVVFSFSTLILLVGSFDL